jgi:hypothetical protein
MLRYPRANWSYSCYVWPILATNVALEHFLTFALHLMRKRQFFLGLHLLTQFSVPWFLAEPLVQVIKPVVSGEPEKAEISIHEGEDLYRDR